MALAAAEPMIEPFALAQAVRIRSIGLIESGVDLRRGAANPVRHDGNLVERACDRRIEAQLALLAFTGGEQEQRREREQGVCRLAGLPGRSVGASFWEIC